MLTIRNWLIGRHIVEYEQHGEDRAEYGAGLLERLSNTLKKDNVKGMSVTALRNFRQFYSVYPQLSGIIAGTAGLFPPGIHIQIHQIPSDELWNPEKKQIIKLSPEPELLLKNFSFSHFVELIKISDPLKRVFYEIEGVRGCWSVAQLKRQIETLLYERTGLSRCHVLIDLKVGKFSPGDAGQMNYYLNYFKENIMAKSDNFPVVLILCSDRDETRVKYATAGLDSKLFVSKYLTCLPSSEY